MAITSPTLRGRSKDAEFQFLRELVADKTGRAPLVHSKPRDAILRRANTVPKLIPFINQRTATLTEVSHAAHLASFLRSASKSTDPGGKATTAYLDVLLMSQETSGVLEAFEGTGSGLDALLYVISLADTMPGSVTSRALLTLQLVLSLRLKKSMLWTTADQDRVTQALDAMQNVKKVADNPDVDMESEACRKILARLSGAVSSPTGPVVDLMSPPATLTAAAPAEPSEPYRGIVPGMSPPTSATQPPPPPPPARMGTITPPVPTSWSSSAWSSHPPTAAPPPPPPPPQTPPSNDDASSRGRQRSSSRHDDSDKDEDDGRGWHEESNRKRSHSADTSGISDASPVKKMRSVREYRSQKRSGSDRNSLLKSYHHTQEYKIFDKFLKDEVYKLTQLHIRRSNPEMCDHDADEAPEWRKVAKAISQTLMEKELRLDSTVRFNLSSDGLKESAMKRIKGYCISYLNRKFPLPR